MTDAVKVPGWHHTYSGKVRDLYEPDSSSDDRLLVVASDRISAFDHVLDPSIPGKGALLTQLSLWWFTQLSRGPGAVPNHLAVGTVPPEAGDRGMLALRLNMLPVECVVRGYITGSGWTEYLDSGTITGIPLPSGLREGDRLPEPIFTPAFKAPLGQHDENITFAETEKLVGHEHAMLIRDYSVSLYSRAAEISHSKGLILADTKFEFGADAEGVIRVGDEILTSDSSRYWSLAAWESETAPARRMASFDKQIVRDWLRMNWDQVGTPPTLPPEVVRRTADRYQELFERITSEDRRDARG